MKRRGVWIIVIAVALATSIAVAVALLLSVNERGPELALKLVQRGVPGELRWGEVSGALKGPLQVKDLEYRQRGRTYRIERLDLDWDPTQLLTAQLDVHSLRLGAVDITLTEPDGRERPGHEPDPMLPFQLRLHDIRIDTLRIRRGSAAPLVLRDLAIDAVGDAKAVDVKQFSVRTPWGTVSAHGRIGLEKQARTDLTLAWQSTLPGYAPIAGQGTLRGTREQLRLVQQIETPQRGRLVVEVEQPFAALRWNAQLEATAWRPNAFKADWPEQTLDATLHASGTRDAYRVALDLAADLAANDTGAASLPVAVEASAQGDRRGLNIDNLTLRALNGMVHGQGRVEWSKDLQWTAQLQARELDPAQRWAALPGRLSAQAKISGTTAAGHTTLAARIEHITGELRGRAVGGHSALTLRSGAVHVDDLRLTIGAATLTLQGVLADELALRWCLQAPRLDDLLPRYAGTATATGRVTGSRAHPRVRAQVDLRAVQGPSLRVDALQVDADLSAQAHSRLNVALRGNGVRLGERRLSDVALDVGGELERHTLRLRARGPAHRFDLDARGGWSDSAWSGRLVDAAVAVPELGAWRMSAPASLQLARAAGTVERICFEQAPARVCGDYRYAPTERALQAELRGGALDRVQALLPEDVAVQGGALTARVQARQSASGPLRGSAELRIGSGRLSWPYGTQRRQASFGGMRGDVRLDADGARADLAVDLSGRDYLRVSARAPGYGLQRAPAQQPIEGRVRGEIRDLALADGLVEGIDDLSGVVTLQGALSGTLAAARVRGELSLRDGQMFIGAVGVRLEDWRMTLKDRADGMLELKGSARSGPGRVQIVGRIRPTGTAGKRGAAAPTAELHITGNDFRSVNLPEAEVLTHPQLRLTARQRRVVIDGAVHIPQARIEPRDRGGAVAPSRDVLRVDAQVPPTSAGWQVDSHVRLTLGERVTFKGFGLRGRVGGALTVISEPDKQPRARGELVLHDGIYGAYGQELKIERGRALFRDSPLDNPGIDVRATRTSGEVVAGVRMLGTVREPRTELYSKPPLPQADVLSYLLLGRPLAGASGGEGEMLYRAASTLGLKGGAQVAQSIGRRFGIDEVALAGSELETAALTLGKYLSPRLYLNYSIGLLEAADKLRVRYQLTKHLSVQTEAGAATGGDVLYLLER